MGKKYIDADELLKRLNSCKYPAEKPTMRQATYNAAISDACRIVDAIPAVDIPRWIPVTERLPEEAGQYLVSGKYANEDGEVWICKFARLYNWGWCNKAERPVVQAWMPFPEPYKGGEEE